jgi:hypothetical protein
MTPWQEFYNSIRDPSWPDCKLERDFDQLPDVIKQECQQVHGYVPGEYASQSALAHKVFPIKTATACQLKWNWSTIYLTTENTASCHRTNHHKFDTTVFDFHNTPSKLEDRQKMLNGQWPTAGCEYCQKIEDAGGQSDRITNLDMPGIHAPVELNTDPTAINVTPRILEVYFNNTCNLKCVYCGPMFSSLWDAENRKHKPITVLGQEIFQPFTPSKNIEKNKLKLFDWLRTNGQYLTNFNVLGGEPLFQNEFDECLELFEQHPAPDLDLQIFSNLNVKSSRVIDLISKVRRMIDCGSIKNFTVTASLDCWGDPQEYARYPLDLVQWEKNFNLLLAEPWIKLVIGSTITPLTIGTLDQLMERVKQWNQIRPVYQYFNSVNNPSYMYIDIFGSLFEDQFERCLGLAADSPVKHYLEGIALQSKHTGINSAEITKLYAVLTELDSRRKTNWRTTFPWLVDPIMRNL